MKVTVLGLRCLLHRKGAGHAEDSSQVPSVCLGCVTLTVAGRVRTTTGLSGDSLEACGSCCLCHWPQGLVVELRCRFLTALLPLRP